MYLEKMVSAEVVVAESFNVEKFGFRKMRDIFTIKKMTDLYHLIN